MAKTAVIIGGHLSPALSAINQLQKHNWQVVYYGRKYTSETAKGVSDEYQVIADRGITFRTLTSGRFHRNSLPQAFKSVLKVPLGIIQALKYLRQDQPNAVVSFGGYLAIPPAVAAWLLRIPIVIHEQTAAAGLANRLTARLADKVAISFATSQPYFPDSKTTLTGNPVRLQATKVIDTPEPLAQFPHNQTIYVTGGGQGSSIINNAVLSITDKLTKHYNLIHGIGPSGHHDQEWQQAQKIKQSLPDKQAKAYWPVRYIGPNHIGSVFAKANLIIGRSGANTCTEIARMHKPAILIPLPYVQMNEQYLNASQLVDLGLAKILPQADLTSDTLVQMTQAMLAQIDQYKAEAEEIDQVYPQDADLQLYQLIAQATSI